MTIDEQKSNEVNFEYTQMLGRRAYWQKSSIYSNFSIKIGADKLLEDLKMSKKGKNLASQIYFYGLDKFVCRNFRYDFLGFA